MGPGVCRHAQKGFVMSVVPRPIGEKLSFFEQHLPVWTKDPASIGLNSDQVAELSVLVSQAREKVDEVNDLRSRSRAATNSQSVAVGAMAELGGDLIKTIRAFAETNNDPNVFGAAQIPLPAPPTPAGPPDQPKILKAQLLSPFGLRITWEGSAARGTYFNVWRKLGGERSFSFVGTAKTRRLDDLTIPDGSASVSYFVAAHRAALTTNSSVLEVRFGSGVDGSMTLAA
jgi:hypothetical protein